MLVGKYISKLVADTWSVSDDLINVSMRMAVDPVVNSTILNIIFMFNCKGSIEFTSFKL